MSRNNYPIGIDQVKHDIHEVRKDGNYRGALGIAYTAMERFHRAAVKYRDALHEKEMELFSLDIYVSELQQNHAAEVNDLRQRNQRMQRRIRVLEAQLTAARQLADVTVSSDDDASMDPLTLAAIRVGHGPRADDTE